MALVVADRVKETTTTTGTGTITLAGASTGYQSFSAIGNGNQTYYTIAEQLGSDWEVGIGTYTSSGTTLSRDTVLSSSNSGSLVNFGAGIKDVFVTQPAGRTAYVVGTTATFANSGIVPTSSGGTSGSSAQAGMNNLAGAVTSGYYLRGNGTNVVMAAISAGDVPTLNQNTTGYAAYLQSTTSIGGTHTFQAYEDNTNFVYGYKLRATGTTAPTLFFLDGSTGNWLGGLSATSSAGLSSTASNGGYAQFTATKYITSSSASEILYGNTSNSTPTLNLYTSGTLNGYFSANSAGSMWMYNSRNATGVYLSSGNNGLQYFASSAYNIVLHAGNYAAYSAFSGTVSGVNGSFTGALNVGSAIGSSRGTSLSVSGSNGSSSIATKSGSYATVFATLPWSSGDTYLSSGTYYDNNSWTHASDGAYNCLFAFSGSAGARWYASNNSSPSWNVASNASLWNNAGTWTGAVNASSGQVGGNTILTSANYYTYALPLSAGSSYPLTGTLYPIQGSTTAISLSSGYYIGMGSWGLRNSTPYGYIEFGPANSSYAHIYSSGLPFYFNQTTMYANGDLILNAGNYSSYALPLSGGTMTGALVVTAADRGLEVNSSGGISFYNNEINAGALGGTGSLYLGYRRTSQVYVRGGNVVLGSDNYSSYALPLSAGQSYPLTAGLTIDSGHGGTRLQLKFVQGPSSAYDGYLTAWVSEPGLTYNMCGIGGNIYYGGQYYGRQTTAMTYGTYIRWDNNAGQTQFWVTTGTPGVGGGQGSNVAYVGADGNFYATTSAYLVLHSNNYSSYALPLSGGTISGNLGLGVAPDIRLSLNGDAQISGLLYMGGTAGSAGSWGSRDYTTSGVRYFNASSYQWNNYGYGSTYTFLLNASYAQFSMPVWSLGQNNTFGSSAQTTVSTVYIAGSTSNSSAWAVLRYDLAGTSLGYVRNDGVYATGGAANSPYNLTTANAANVVIQGSTVGVLYRSTSSARYKNSIEDIPYGLAEVMQLRPVTYRGLNDGGKRFAGFIAEDIDMLGLKEFVVYDEHDRPDALAYGNMTAMLAKAIQELKMEFEAYKAANPPVSAVSSTAPPWQG